MSDDPPIYGAPSSSGSRASTFALDMRMDVPGPQRVTGTMSGTFSSGGERCRMDRDLTARFARA